VPEQVQPHAAARVLLVHVRACFGARARARARARVRAKVQVRVRVSVVHVRAAAAQLARPRCDDERVVRVHGELRGLGHLFHHLVAESEAIVLRTA
jgi:hypothetical protein